MIEVEAIGKRELTKRQNRERILDAAREVFSSIGLEAATIRDVVRESGLAAGTFYNYYRSKSEVVTALEAEAVRKFAPMLDNVLESSSTFEAFVHDALSAYFTYISDSSVNWVAARPASEAASGPSIETPEMIAIFAKIEAAIGSAIERYAQASEPQYAAAACVAVAREVGKKMLQRRPIDVSSAVAFATTMVLDGLAGFPAREPSPKS